MLLGVAEILSTAILVASDFAQVSHAIGVAAFNAETS
jgi:hypothetical protein